MVGKGTVRSSGLARALSKTGYCSRSQARRLIANGRVRVTGHVVRDPEKPVVFGKDSIEVDGNQVRAGEKIYLMLNKPRGLVTTARDEQGRPTVYSLLPERLPWVAPVGRLDKASEGLLLLTNDSEWGARITSPDSHLDKTYHAQIATVADDDLLRRLTAGFEVEGGELLQVKGAALLRTGKKNCWLEIVLDEGRNRQIRRLLAALGIEVLRLVRTAIGQVRLGDLAKGKTRPLTRAERASLRVRR